MPFTASSPDEYLLAFANSLYFIEGKIQSQKQDHARVLSQQSIQILLRTLAGDVQARVDLTGLRELLSDKNLAGGKAETQTWDLKSINLLESI